MKVYKFGGASVKDADSVRNVYHILNRNDQVGLVVVSAMGKTTNALEKLAASYSSGKEDTQEQLEAIIQDHERIITDLFGADDDSIRDEVFNTFVEIEWMLEDEPHPDAGFNYDQIVSVGELVSSKILAAYLKKMGLPVRWIDARSYIHTDNTYQEANVEWEKSLSSIRELLKDQGTIYISQGFIGGTSENFTTTLGREGSDYSAAIFASGLEAESLTIWKDVAGVLSADPKHHPNAIKFEELPYSEALEMAYYGATIIHPKTIKPLQNAGIPLFVKAFHAPDEPGTHIHQEGVRKESTETIIYKANQTLISISTPDFSFIDEETMGAILSILSDCRIRMNMMQVSALSFSCCIDAHPEKTDQVLLALQSRFKIRYNSGLELLTIRHYNRETLGSWLEGKELIMEQFSRSTAQFILRKIE